MAQAPSTPAGNTPRHYVVLQFVVDGQADAASARKDLTDRLAAAGVSTASFDVKYAGANEAHVLEAAQGGSA